GSFVVEGDTAQINVIVGLFTRREGDFSVNDGQFLDQFGKPCSDGGKIMGHDLSTTSPNHLRRQGCINQTLSRAHVPSTVEVFLPKLTKRNLMSIKSLGKFAAIAATARLALTACANDSVSQERDQEETCGLIMGAETKANEGIQQSGMAVQQGGSTDRVTQ